MLCRVSAKEAAGVLDEMPAEEISKVVDEIVAETEKVSSYALSNWNFLPVEEKKAKCQHNQELLYHLANQGILGSEGEQVRNLLYSCCDLN